MRIGSPGAVSGAKLIEKEMHGGSLLSISPLKSPGGCAEEILVRVERHGNARYSMG
jgi:hypothetical protein